MMFYRVWGCCWCGLSSLLRATTTWAPENDDFSSLRFFFSSFHFIFPPYKKNTRPVKESLRSCARQSSEDRRLGRRSKGGFQLLLDFFFLFSFSTKEDRLILFKKGIRKKDTHKWRERESRKKPCGCELCPFYTIPGGWPLRTNFHYAHSLVRSFVCFFLSWNLKAGSLHDRNNLYLLHFDDSTLWANFLSFRFYFYL